MDEVRIAFRELWEKIYNPKSACPDVEIGQVRDAMEEILNRPRKNLPREQQFIIAQLSFSEMTELQLNKTWKSRIHWELLDLDDYSDEHYAKYELAATQMRDDSYLPLTPHIDTLIQVGVIIRLPNILRLI